MIRPCLTAETMPARPGAVSTMPAADFATSVAVDTAIPICAWGKRWRVIGAIAAHADDVTGGLIGLHQIELVFGQHSGKDRVVLDTTWIREAARRTERAAKTDGTRHREGRHRRVAGDHHNSDA